MKCNNCGKQTKKEICVKCGFNNTNKTRDETFFQKLTDIKGISKKTAEDIESRYTTEEQLKAAIQDEEHLGFRDDVEKQLKKIFK